MDKKEVLAALSIKLREEFYADLTTFLKISELAELDSVEVGGEIIDSALKVAIAFCVTYGMDKDAFLKVCDSTYDLAITLRDKIDANMVDKEETDLTPTHKGSNSVN